MEPLTKSEPPGRGPHERSKLRLGPQGAPKAMDDLLELLAQLAVTIAALSAVAGAAGSRGVPSAAVTSFLLRDVEKDA